ncbi:hypothetical protein HNP40_000833 [Mycobacteroides chelonae]|nr:hypothetical protein [Mycobacteroides chelonae]
MIGRHHMSAGADHQCAVEPATPRVDAGATLDQMNAPFFTAMRDLARAARTLLASR